MIFIRIKVKGCLKNITENEMISFEEKAIKNKNKISFIFDNTKYDIKVLDKEIVLIRDAKDFVNTFIFNEKSGKSNYLLKENNYEIEMNVKVDNMDIGDNYLNIIYRITDTDNLYEFRLEMSE